MLLWLFFNSRNLPKSGGGEWKNLRAASGLMRRKTCVALSAVLPDICGAFAGNITARLDIYKLGRMCFTYAQSYRVLSEIYGKLTYLRVCQSDHDLERKNEHFAVHSCLTPDFPQTRQTATNNNVAKKLVQYP